MIFDYETLNKSLIDIIKDCNIERCNYASINTTSNFSLLREKGLINSVKSYIITVDIVKYSIENIYNKIRTLLEVSNVTYRIYDSSINKSESTLSFILVPYFISIENIKDKRVLNSIMGEYHSRNNNITYNFLKDKNGIFVETKTKKDFVDLKNYLFKKHLVFKILFWLNNNTFLMIIKQ